MAHALGNVCRVCGRKLKAKKEKRVMTYACSSHQQGLERAFSRNILQTSILRASVSPDTWSCRDLTKLPRKVLMLYCCHRTKSFWSTSTLCGLSSAARCWKTYVRMCIVVVQLIYVLTRHSSASCGVLHSVHMESKALLQSDMESCAVGHCPLCCNVLDRPGLW